MRTLRILQTQRTLPEYRFRTLGIIALRQLSPNQDLRFPGLRFKATASKKATSRPTPSTSPPRTLSYPDELCIYQASETKCAAALIVRLLGDLCATSILIPWSLEGDVPQFSGSLIFRNMVIFGPLMLLGQWLSSPVVHRINLSLPQSARLSSNHLRHYINNLPPSTTLDIITHDHMFAGKRVNSIPLSKLYLLREESRLRHPWDSNLEREPGGVMEGTNTFHAPAAANVVGDHGWAWDLLVSRLGRKPKPESNE
ncbi:uncharacterized protein GGS22DRAFT_72979 [Annulohypoxylon maeteangense]|uniref:uncharacterized protein n=1 Tax=Annulohypoxylon maeteangense TaxID=1927788 RepID=UPI0020085B7E|nr:uncharacterized protein GGS22DRAFT_72979 [Annulohypoxylon maeteangense]KAI0881249.1 hypothetical protein GGS22DRAFT_72979 [Annulohypoxylon maeteangense]